MAEQSVPDSVPAEAVEAAAEWFSRWMGASSVRKRDREYAREVLVRAAPILVAAGRAQAAADLRFAAEGRAEYARTASPEHRELLAFEAGTLDHAAAVAGGDIQPLYGWVPSRMWTPEMNAKLAEEAP